MNILFLNSVLKITVWLSLLIQIITAFVDIYVLRINIPESMKLIKQLVIFELIVQIIEGIFYIWLAFSLLTIPSISGISVNSFSKSSFNKGSSSSG